MKDVLSRYQCIFHKGFNEQYCLVNKIQWKESMGNGGAFVPL